MLQNQKGEKKIDGKEKTSLVSKYKIDPCVFKRENNGTLSLLLLFTDDIALITKTNNEANEIISLLSKKIKLKHLGEIKKYLGLTINKTKNGFKISQEDKICQLIKTFKMELCKPAKTPMSQEVCQTDDRSFTQNVNIVEYTASGYITKLHFMLNKLNY